MFLKESSLESLQSTIPSIFNTSSTSMSDKYLHIPTVEIVNSLLANDFKVIGAKGSKSRKHTPDVVKHVIFLTHKSIEKDKLQLKAEIPMLRIENSHNGTCALNIGASLFRLVCSNGLIVPSTYVQNEKVRHLKGVEKDIIEASYRVVNGFNDLNEHVGSMKSLTLNQDGMFDFAEKSLKLVFTDEEIALNMKHGIDLRESVLTSRRYEDNKNDLWTIFNVVQENLIRGGFKKMSLNQDNQVIQRKKRAVNSIDVDRKINVGLMELALDFSKVA